VKLRDAVSAIVDWRLNTTLPYLFDVCYAAQCEIAMCVCDESLTVRSLDCWFSELAKMGTSLSEYFIAVTFLHIAGKNISNWYQRRVDGRFSESSWRVY